jgi:hypothetical protein
MPVDPLSLFVLPLVLALTALFAATAAYDFIIFRRRKNIAKAVVYRCDACRHIYTVPCRIPLARCPKCGKQNEPIKT